MLITFEGIDGSGKSTQIELLKNYLLSKGKQVLTFREPGGTPFAEKIREILLDHHIEINAISELLLFESARADLTEKNIIPAIKEGKIVILDRYFDSTTAYQGFGRGLDLTFIESLNKQATFYTIPDITFYLRIPYSVSLERRKQKIDRMELAGDDFYHRLIDGYDKLAEQNPKRIKVIDSTQSIDSIFLEIKKFIDKLI